MGRIKGFERGHSKRRDRRLGVGLDHFQCRLLKAVHGNWYVELTFALPLTVGSELQHKATIVL
jgi:hypothetical protein